MDHPSWSKYWGGGYIVLTFSNFSDANVLINDLYLHVFVMIYPQFLAYDTQLLVGGRRYELSPEEYIFGAMNLYIDVVYLFLIILSLFGGGSR